MSELPADWAARAAWYEARQRQHPRVLADEVVLWRLLAPLLPYAVPVPPRPRRRVRR